MYNDSTLRKLKWNCLLSRPEFDFFLSELPFTYLARLHHFKAMFLQKQTAPNTHSYTHAHNHQTHSTISSAHKVCGKATSTLRGGNSVDTDLPWKKRIFSLAANSFLLEQKPFSQGTEELTELKKMSLWVDWQKIYQVCLPVSDLQILKTLFIKTDTIFDITGPSSGFAAALTQSFLRAALPLHQKWKGHQNPSMTLCPNLQTSHRHTKGR